VRIRSLARQFTAVKGADHDALTGAEIPIDTLLENAIRAFRKISDLTPAGWMTHADTTSLLLLIQPYLPILTAILTAGNKRRIKYR